MDVILSGVAAAVSIMNLYLLLRHRPDRTVPIGSGPKRAPLGEHGIPVTLGDEPVGLV